MDNGLLNKKDSQMIKGIAIISVIASHMAYIISIPSKIEILMHPLGYLGVSLFLAISGYGCVVSNWHGKTTKLEFLKKRITKILPLLVVTTWGAVILNYILYGHEFDFLEVVWNSFGIINSIGRFTWYIGFQYFWYVLFSVFETKHPRVYLGAVIVYIISFAIKCPSIQFDMWGLNCLSFPTGVWIAINEASIKRRLNKIKQWKVLLITGGSFGSAFIFCYFVLHNPSELIIQSATKSMVSTSFVILVITIFVVHNNRIEQSAIGGGLQIVGTISYELYLIHGYWIFVLSDFFTPEKNWKIIVYVCGTIFLAIILHGNILKMVRYSNSWRRQRRN